MTLQPPGRTFADSSLMEWSHREPISFTCNPIDSVCRPWQQHFDSDFWTEFVLVLAEPVHSLAGHLLKKSLPCLSRNDAAWMRPVGTAKHLEQVRREIVEFLEKSCQC